MADKNTQQKNDVNEIYRYLTSNKLPDVKNLIQRDFPLERLSEAYQRAKFTNVPLSEEIECYITELLIGSYFQEGIISDEPFNARVQRLLTNIEQLATMETVNEHFLLNARYIAIDIHILKYQMKFSNDRLPWEEIELYTVLFVSSISENVCITYKLLLDSKILQIHLQHFAKALNNEMEKISEISKIETTRNVIKENITKRYHFFTELYEDYETIKTIYSLDRITDQIEIAMSVDSTTKIGQLAIQRTLQVVGESLKSTKLSPNFSDEIYSQIMKFLPRNMKRILTSVRDSLSHTWSLQKRMDIEADQSFYTHLQHDIKKFDTEIKDLLYQKKREIIRKNFDKIQNEENKMLLFANLDPRDQDDDQCAGVFDQLQILIVELQEMITDITESEKEVFNKIFEFINRYKRYASRIKQDYHNKLALASQFQNTMMNISSVFPATLDEIAGQSKTQLMKTVISTFVTQIKTSFKSRRQFCAEYSKISEKCQNIHDLLLLESNKIKDLHIYREMLSKKQNNIKGKEDFVFREVIEKITDDNDRKFVETVLQNPNENSYRRLLESTRKKQRDFTQCFNEFFRSVIKSKKLQNEIQTIVADIFSEGSNYFKQYTERLETLKLIANNRSHFELYMDCKKDRKLQMAIEMLVLDLTEILKNTRCLQESMLFIDDTYPALVGTCLRNYLAHGNALFKIVPINILAAIVANALKMVEMGCQIFECKPTYRKMENFNSKFTKCQKWISTSTKLFELVRRGTPADIQKFLETEEVAVQIRDIRSQTLLHIAAKECNFQTFQYLFSKGLNDIDKTQQLLDVAAIGSESIVLYTYMQVKETPDFGIRSKESLLHVASSHGYYHIVHELLLNGVDVNTKSLHNSTPMYVAARNGHHTVVELLLRNAANVHEGTIKGTSPLHAASKGGHLTTIRSLLAFGADVNSTNVENQTPLHVSTVHGHYPVVEELLKNGAQTHITDTSGLTALHLAAGGVDSKIVSLLINNGADINSFSLFNLTPLHLAASVGNAITVKSLLENGAKVNVQNHKNWTPLHTACYSGKKDVAEILIEYGSDLEVANDRSWRSIHLAASQGHTHIVKMLLDNGISVNTQQNKKSTPLHLAAANGHKTTVELLLDQGADGKVLNDFGLAPIHLASMSGHYSVVEALLKTGNNVNLKSRNCETPLHSASWCGHHTVVSKLLDAGASIDERNRTQKTALHEAVIKGHQHVVQILLERGAEINFRDENSMTPLQCATVLGYHDIVQILLSRKNTNHHLESEILAPMLLAPFSGDEFVLKEMLKYGFDANTRSPNNLTPLYAAVKKGNITMVQTLLENKADVNVQSDTYWSPIHMAVYKGNKDIVQMLLDKGADVNSCKNDSITPLHVAAYAGHRDIVELILQKGASVTAQIAENNQNLTPLHLSSFGGHLDIVKKLLNHGAQINSTGRTPLLLAACCGHYLVVRELLAQGAQVGAVDNNKLSSLHVAAYNGHVNVMKELFTAAQLDIEAKNEDGSTALHLAAYQGHHLAVAVLLQHGAYVDSIDTFMFTPLHRAVRNGHKDVVRLLLDNSADVFARNYHDTVLHQSAASTDPEVITFVVNAIRCKCVDGDSYQRAMDVKDLDGDTPLMWAAEAGRKRAAYILLAAGAGLHVGNSHGETALDWAIKKKNWQTMQLLVNWDEEHCSI